MYYFHEKSDIGSFRKLKDDALEGRTTILHSYSLYKIPV